MTEDKVKIYCKAECKHNREGRCEHPENLDMGCYGGIDRCYVEKCDLLKLKEDDTDAEDILRDILEEEEHERHIEELVLNAIEEGETE